MKKENFSNKLIIKLYRILRNKIKKAFHLILERVPNSSSIIWAFGIIDRSNKYARLFYVLNDGRKETLLPIIKNNVSTIDSKKGNLELKIRVFSYCFAPYSEEDFRGLNYIL